jgi:cathepsin A (carboxypeptidase C)
MSAHPEYSTQPFFVFGESFGGHYAPAIAHAILTKNLQGGFPVVLNLQGLGLGNGLTDPVTQYQVRTLLPCWFTYIFLKKKNKVYFF